MICQCGRLNFLVPTSSDSELSSDKTFSPTLNTQKQPLSGGRSKKKAVKNCDKYRNI